MNIAYLDCFSGISGDMFLGALLDAGLPFGQLEACLETLPLEHYRISACREKRHHISGIRFQVEFDRDAQPERRLPELREILAKGSLSESVRSGSLRVFEDLARVEGEIHGIPSEEVHFHEVGAVDSIIDIVGTLYGLEALGIAALHVSALPLGSGFIRTSHGTIPIPSPATLNLLRNVPVYSSGVAREMVTPTGAALVARLARGFGSMPSMVIRRTGYGVGSRDLEDRPNLARIVMGDDEPEHAETTVVVLETNLDDMNPEWMGHLMERLLEQGALDVVFVPVQMKKGRPAVQVQLMGRPHQRDTLMDVLFAETTALGVRYHYTERKVLHRSHTVVESPWGSIRVKQSFRADGSPCFLPEYEVCREIARNTGRPLKEIYHWIQGLNRP